MPEDLRKGSDRCRISGIDRVETQDRMAIGPTGKPIAGFDQPGINGAHRHIVKESRSKPYDWRLQCLNHTQRLLS